MAAFVEGISLWPTEVIRVFTLLLCFYLLHAGWVLLSDNLDEIAEKFGAKKAHADMTKQQDRAEVNQGKLDKLLQMVSMRFIVPLHRQPGVDHGMKSEAVDFWGSYIVQKYQIGVVSDGIYNAYFWRYSNLLDLGYSLIKAVVFALLVISVGVYYGYNVTGGAVGIGRAVAKTMAVSLLLTTVVNAVLTNLFWGHTPNLPIPS